MKGYETFNAELVWSSFSDETASRFRGRGGTPQSLQAQMDQSKQAGAQIEQVNYIGGQSFPDSTSMHFYVVLSRGPRSNGDGDVRLSPLLGAYLGWLNPGLVAVGLFLGFFAGAVVGVAMMASGRAGRKTAVPFGPFLALGTIVAVFVGQRSIDIFMRR